MRAAVVSFAVLAALGPRLVPPQSTSSAPLGVLVKRLEGVKVRPDETDVPVVARPLLKELKHRLRDLIGDSLNDGKPAKSAAEAQRRIDAKLRSHEVKVEGPGELLMAVGTKEPDFTYGGIYGVSAHEVPGRTDLIVATTTLAVCCGEDSSLYVFRQAGGKWELGLADEVGDYVRVDAAHGTFRYGIGQQGGKDFFLVTADVSPWCTSNWQTIRYRVLKVGASPYAPRVVLEDKRPIYVGVDPPPYELEVHSDGFTLRFKGGENPDPSGPPPAQVVRYAVLGDKATWTPAQ